MPTTHGSSTNIVIIGRLILSEKKHSDAEHQKHINNKYGEIKPMNFQTTLILLNVLQVYKIQQQGWFIVCFFSNLNDYPAGIDKIFDAVQVLS